MTESNGLPLLWRDEWAAFAKTFSLDIPLPAAHCSHHALVTKASSSADYDPEGTTPILREEDPEMELRLDQLFGTKPKI